MLDNWPFDQAPNVYAITTRQVLEGHPILLVNHYADDDSWGFLCGTTNETTDGRVIGMGEAVQLDPTLLEIGDLPTGWTAWRESVGGKWDRRKVE